jgi:hypothetical protein
VCLTFCGSAGGFAPIFGVNPNAQSPKIARFLDCRGNPTLRDTTPLWLRAERPYMNIYFIGKTNLPEILQYHGRTLCIFCVSFLTDACINISFSVQFGADFPSQSLTEMVSPFNFHPLFSLTTPYPILPELVVWGKIQIPLRSWAMNE